MAEITDRNTKQKILVLMLLLGGLRMSQDHYLIYTPWFSYSDAFHLISKDKANQASGICIHTQWVCQQWSVHTVCMYVFPQVDEPRNTKVYFQVT